MILVTGAAGKTGRAVTSKLASRCASVRGLVHRAEQAEVLESQGAEQVVVGDMHDQSTMDRAMRGVRAVYHICPNVSPDEIVMGRMALASALASGAEHFAYHSVLHPQAEAMPHHWRKMRVEEAILESGLPFTILQPAAYMQNVAAHWELIAREGIYPVPYAVETRLSLVDLLDVAEVASIVLTEKGHRWATYELAGSEALSQTEMAAVLGRQLGRTVRARAISREAWRREARAAGLEEEQADMLSAMFEYYEGHGFLGNPRVLAWLLGRPPTTFDAYVRREAEQRAAVN